MKKDETFTLFHTFSTNSHKLIKNIRNVITF